MPFHYISVRWNPLKCLNVSSILFGIIINNTNHNKLLLCDALKINVPYTDLNVYNLYGKQMRK